VPDEVTPPAPVVPRVPLVPELGVVVVVVVVAEPLALGTVVLVVADPVALGIVVLVVAPAPELPVVPAVPEAPLLPMAPPAPDVPLMLVPELLGALELPVDPLADGDEVLLELSDELPVVPVVPEAPDDVVPVVPLAPELPVLLEGSVVLDEPDGVVELDGVVVLEELEPAGAELPLDELSELVPRLDDPLVELPESVAPAAPLAPAAVAAPAREACFFTLRFFFVALRSVPVTSVLALSVLPCCAICAAFCSTAAARAGSVLSVTPLDEEAALA
jgi:hypothetical protein